MAGEGEVTKHVLPEWVRGNLASLPVERELPKWPTLQVAGQNVSPELGREICLRTTDPGRLLPSRSEAWGQAVCAAYGVPLGDHNDWLPYEERERLREELGILDLEYLGNDRVTATRFELPSGWCNWDGSIGTHGTDLDAKWPKLDDLNQELALIARTWPELAMTVQLSSYKDSERFEERWPILTWVVEDGRVELLPQPGFRLWPVNMPVVEPEGITEETERGVDIGTLRQAINEAKERNG
jgi:hypothetical protein